jgi:hypothetical protein
VKHAGMALPDPTKSAESNYEASVSPPPPQDDDEDIPAARKKPRLEDPFSGSTDEAATKTAPAGVAMAPSPPPAIDDIDDNDDADAESVTDTQPNAGDSTRATSGWTFEEYAKLSRAVANTSKKRWGKEYRTDWVASWGKNMHV